MKQNLLKTWLMLCLFILLGGGNSAWGADVINNSSTSSKLGSTGTSSWVEAFDLTLTSGAVVNVRSMGTKSTSNALQWNSNGYLYMKTSGGKLKSVTIKGASKTVNVYASNTAYSAVPSGTALGTISVTSTGATYNFTSDYTYLALKGTTSSTSITEITIEYETAATVPYTVTFNAGSNGICSTSSLTEASVGAGVTLPSCTANPNYTFVGWSTTSTPTSADAGAAGATYKPSSNCTLYAYYTYQAPSHDAKFFVNGQQYGETQSVEEGASITFPADPADIDGKKFQGWTKTQNYSNATTAPSDLCKAATMGDADITYYAVFATAEGSGAESTWSITPTNLDKPGSGSGYTPYNGTHTLDNYSYVTNQVMVQSSNVQFQTTNGYIYNTTSFGNITKIIVTGTNALSVYDCQSETTSKPSSGALTATGSGPYTFTFSGNNGFFFINANGSTPKASEITVYYNSTTYSDYTTSVVKKYDVTFNLQEHGEAIASQAIAEGETVTEPTAPEATGYTFGGWYKEAECTNAWNFSTDVMGTSAITLYAKWTVNTYTITYNNVEGATHSNPTTYTIETATINLAYASKSGFIFQGWFDNEGLTGDAVTTIAQGSTGDKTFWAKWAEVPANPSTVTFNVGEHGTCETASATEETVGAGVALPEVTAAEGWVFKGWSTENPATAETIVSAGGDGKYHILANTTLYAFYKVKPATPAFSSAAGDIEKGTEVTISCTTEGANIYYTTNGDEPTAESTAYSEAIAVNAAQTLKAIAILDGEQSDVASAAYTIVQHTAQFSINGVITAANNCTVAKGEAITFPADPTAPEEHVFIGWKKGGDEVTTPQNDAIATVDKATEVMGTDDVTYYAVWAVGSGSGEASYDLVESAPDNWAGDYLIVYNNKYAMNTHSGNQDANTFATYTDISEYYTDASKSIASNTTTDALVYRAAQTTNGYSLYCVSDESYLGITASTTGTGSKLRWNTSYTESADDWTLGVGSIGNVGSNTLYIRWNNNSNQERFAAYSSSGQQAIQLFKKTAGSSYSDYCTRVSLDPKPTIVLSATELAEYAGNTNTSITASVSEGAYTGTLAVESSAEAVATASISEGTITINALTAGSATITVTAPAVEGQFRKNTATIAVTVSEKLAHGLSFSADALNLTVGDTEFTEPTLSNPNSLPVVYSLVYAKEENKDKVATIDPATGKITLADPSLSTETQGAVTVKAHTDGDNSHVAGEVTYNLVVARKVTTTSWSNEGAAVTIDKDEIATLPTASNDGERNLFYESSNEEVAKFVDGALTFVAYGTTTITAKTTATAEYAATSASYKLTFAPRYTVSFAYTDKTKASDDIRETIFGSGITLPVNPGDKDGYRFLGWATTTDATSADAGVAGATYKPSDNETLYAFYAQLHTAKFYVNGEEQNANTQSLIKGETIVFPTTDPENINGMKFMGWTKDEIDGTTENKPAIYTEATMGDADLKFYAVFARKSGSSSTVDIAMDATSTTKDGVTIACAQNGSNNTAPAYTSNECRIYAKNSITISASESITAFSLTFHKQGSKDYISSMTASTGTYTSGGASTSGDDNKVDTWTGSATSITLTAGSSGQRVLVGGTITVCSTTYTNYCTTLPTLTVETENGVTTVTGTVSSDEDVASVTTGLVAGTSIDMTDAIVTDDVLSSISDVVAGQNVLIYAPESSSSTAVNVVVDGKCENLVLTDKVAVNIPEAIQATNITYERKTGDDIDKLVAGKYATVCLPYAFPIGEFKVMKFAGVEGSVVNFEYVTETEPNVPYVIRPNNVAEASLSFNITSGKNSVTTTVSEPAGGMSVNDKDTDKMLAPRKAAQGDEGATGFYGTYESLTLKGNDGYYGFASGVFKKANTTSGTGIKPFRAYLFIDSSNGARPASFNFSEGEATAINNVFNALDNNLPMYDLSGRRIQTPAKGQIVIVGGQKVMFK